ncbi:MAG TPA: hypothetical protein VH475_13045 [Tepidisphaeraceae bacterium]|jgi:hypothetical protein
MMPCRCCGRPDTVEDHCTRCDAELTALAILALDCLIEQLLALSTRAPPAIAAT